MRGDDIRVVVCDDHALFRRGLVMALEDVDGIEVVAEAGDGPEAVSVASDLGPDVVLMDVSLPLVNGLDATAALKREPRTRNIPIMALTAHAMAGDKEKCLEAGCDDYDTKPIEFKRLLGKIEALLGSAR